METRAQYRIQKTVREDYGPTGRINHTTWWRVIDETTEEEHSRWLTKQDAKATIDACRDT